MLNIEVIKFEAQDVITASAVAKPEVKPEVKPEPVKCICDGDHFCPGKVLGTHVDAKGNVCQAENHEC